MKSSMKRLLLVLFAAGLVLLVYGKTISFGFFNFDDSKIVTNPCLRNPSASSLSLIWHGHCQTYGEFLPITDTSFWANAFWTSKAWFFHLTNILLHLLNASLFFFILRSFSLPQKTSWFFATLFAVHPAFVEVVTWISARKDLMLLLFVQFGLLLWIRSYKTRKHSLVFLSFSLVCFLAACLAKKSAVVMFPFLPLLDFFFAKDKRQFFERAPERYMPLGLLTVLLGAYLMAFVQLPHRDEIREYGFGFHWLTALDIYAEAFITMISPLREATYASLAHAPNTISLGNLLNVSGLFLGSLLLIFFFKKRWFLEGFAFIFFLVAFLPYLNLVPNPILFAERFLYLPSLGLFLLGASLTNRFASSNTKALKIAGTLILVGYVCWGFTRVALWAHPEKYWANAEEHFPRSSIIQLKKGEAWASKKNWAHACKAFHTAYELGGTNPIIQSAIFQNWGVCQAQKQDFKTAARLFDQAIETKQANPDVYLQGALSHQKIGNIERSKEILSDGKTKFPTHPELSRLSSD